MNAAPEFEFSLALGFCREQLGPASLALMERRDVRDSIQKQVAEGVSMRDAVLKEVFLEAKADRDAAHEFLQYFWDVIVQRTSRQISADLRRQIDTEDVVVSILGDLSRQLHRFEFKNRAAFLNLVSQHFRSKVYRKILARKAQKRREDRRVYPQEGTWNPESPFPSPASEAAEAEAQELAQLGFEKLSPRDRELLGALFEGRTLEEIAQKFDMQLEAARMALKRATDRLRGILPK
ncbi:MAG: hypothetical protein DWQ01_19665 [Planctomycetota bacterium]|nr:MAG: hypothetical protein DWQ01_19665 [Planctomycetota bacterium]